MIFLVCTIIQIAVGVWDIIAGIIHGDFWQGLCGVMFLLWAVPNIAIWHAERHANDPAPPRGLSASKSRPPADGTNFQLGNTCHGEEGDFIPLFIHVRTRDDWWEVIECKTEDLRHLALLLAPYAADGPDAIGQQSEPIGENDAKTPLAATTLGWFLRRLRFGRLIKDAVYVGH